MAAEEPSAGRLGDDLVLTALTPNFLANSSSNFLRSNARSIHDAHFNRRRTYPWIVHVRIPMSLMRLQRLTELQPLDLKRLAYAQVTVTVMLNLVVTLCLQLKQHGNGLVQKAVSHCLSRPEPTCDFAVTLQRNGFPIGAIHRLQMDFQGRRWMPIG